MKNAERVRCGENTCSRFWVGLLFCGMLLGGYVPDLVAQARLSDLSQEWRWKWFGVESGIPPGPVYDIIESPTGTLWVRTRSALAWYDGYRWQTLPPDTLVPHLGRASTLADSAGILLVVPPAVFRVDSQGYTPIPLMHNGAAVQVNRAVVLPGRGLLLQSDRSLYLLHHDTLSLFPSPFEHPLTTRVPEHPFQIYSSKAGTALLNAPDGLYRLEGNRWRRLQAVSGAYLVSTVAGENESGYGALSAHIGIRLEFWEWESGGTVRRTQVEPVETFTSLGIHPDGSFLVIQSSGDISVRVGTTWQKIPSVPPAMLGAIGVYFDSRGDLWIAKSNGVYVCRLSSQIWKSLFQSDRTRSNAINELLFSRDGSSWIGSSEGIRVYRDSTLDRHLREINGVSLGIVTGLAEDVRGNIWVSSGASFGGAFRWDGNSWRHYGSREGFTDNSVHRITNDRNGNLWFLTISRLAPGVSQTPEDGPYVYDGKRFVRVAEPEGMLRGRVYALAHDSSGAYWFGGLRGLARKKGNAWTYWNVENGLRSNRVFTLAVDKDNRLWFGHQSNGLGYIDSLDVPVYATPEDAIPPQSVWDLLVDYSGRLWVATREGLAVHDHGAWSLFGQREGLRNPSLWPLEMKGKRLFVGTSYSGVMILDVGVLEGPPPIVRYQEPVHRGDIVHFAWQTFASREFLPAAEVETRYRVDREKWSPWDVSGTADIANLSSGKHTFEVQARGMLAQVDNSPPVLHFEVPPPFFLNPQFLVPMGVLSILLMILAIRLSRKKREHLNQLRARDERYRAVVDQQIDLIVRTLPDGRLSFVNEAVCTLLGRSREELIGQTLFSVFRTDPSDNTLAALYEAPTASFPRELDVSFTSNDGTARWIRWIADAITNEREEVQELQVVGRDITDRKQAERDLAMSEERYRVLAEQTGQLIYDYDVASGDIAWYGAITDVTGYTNQEFQTVTIKRWEEMIHPDDRDAALAALNTAMTSHKHYDIEYQFLHKDGTYVDIFDNGVFLDGSEGVVKRMLGTMTNITSRKRNEALIATSLKEKEVLLKEIHHRVKNNLQVISSLLNLQSAEVSDHRALEQLRESQHRIRSMALIHERLYQSKNLANIDFENYVRSLCSYLIRSYKPTGVRLVTLLEHISLPVTAAIPCGLIINELVSNALKYAFVGGVQGEIKISMSVSQGKNAVLTVHDTGVGFPAEMDFRKTNTLGMQLVNTLTAQINGTIDLIRGSGTTFSITFPTEL